MTSTLLKYPRLNAPTLHRLPNGLTIIAEQMPVAAVNLSLWVNIGSAVESAEINGMAHFLEHMVFKGTARLEAGEFERRIEERGAVTNAATSQDYTQYYITTAPKDFADLAPLQIDVALNPSIPDDAFERERLVVLEEIRRSEDNPGRRTFNQAMQVAFEQLPYRRQVLGPEAVISELKPQQMRDFHNTYYQPQSLTAVAVGNLPVEEIIETLCEGFANVISTPQETRSPLQSEPAFTEIVRRELIDSSLQQARLVMIWRVPGMQELEETYALDILSGVLGHGRTSRLVRDLREERGLVSGISVSNMSQRLQGIFYISVQLPAENVEIVEDALAQHLQALKTEIIPETEVSRIRTQVASRFIFGNETPSDRAGLYGYYQTLVGDLEPAFNYPDRIKSQGTQDLMQAAQKYLPTDAYGVVVIKPK
ncbi:MAG: insulinase family protein [Nostocaceae cyanobacterium]|nr:insulinase family protein [Nostocaceae cyanobacterium]